MKASLIFKILGLSFLLGLAFAVPHLIVRMIEYKDRIKELEVENRQLIDIRTKPNGSGTINYRGIFLRVQDSLAYQSAAFPKHQLGYSDIYFNDEAERKHWDFWDGEKYQCVFNFNAK